MATERYLKDCKEYLTVVDSVHLPFVAKMVETYFGDRA